jgi:hypothetical protein
MNSGWRYSDQILITAVFYNLLMSSYKVLEDRSGHAMPSPAKTLGSWVRIPLEA